MALIGGKVRIAMKSSNQDAAVAIESRKADYKNAMACLGAAINIVTTDGVGGRAGFAATAVCSVTDNPPTLLVCVNRSSSVYSVVKENKTLCVNVLDGAHKELSKLFGGKTSVDERFSSGIWKESANGLPILEGALASLDCRIKSGIDVGTHEVFLCEVVSIRTKDDGNALIYFNRDYYVIEPRTCDMHTALR